MTPKETLDPMRECLQCSAPMDTELEVACGICMPCYQLADEYDDEQEINDE